MSKLDNLKQNKPSYVVEDLLRDCPSMTVDADDIHRVLLQRGVYKWLACREQMITLKETLRKRLRSLCEVQTEERRFRKLIYNALLSATGVAQGARLRKIMRKLTRNINKRSGEIRGLVSVYQGMRKIFHGPRDQAPTRDKGAQQFLHQARNGLGLV